MKKKEPVQVLKWLSLSLFLLLAGTIIVESSLPGAVSSQQSEFLAALFADVVNLTGHGDTRSVYPASIKIEGPDEVILGTTGRFEAVLDSGDEKRKVNRQAVTFTSSAPDVINIVQKGTAAWVEALGKPEGTITLTVHGEKAGAPLQDGPSATKEFAVVDRKAPPSFKAVLLPAERKINVGETRTMTIEIQETPGVKNWKHNAELNYERDFDVDKLTYESSDDYVAEVDRAVIRAEHPGSAVISVYNKEADPGKEHGYSFPVEVVEGTVPLVMPAGLTSKATIERYVYDLDHDGDEPGVDYHENVGAVFSGDVPSDRTIRYEVEDELVARVDRDGNVFGYKKAGETYVTAISNMDESVFARTRVTVGKAPLLGLEFPKEVTLEVSDQGTLKHSLVSPLNAYDQTVSAVSDDPGVATAGSAGEIVLVTAIAVGKAKVTITANAGNVPPCEVEVTVIPKKIIGNDEFQDFESATRKITGHGLLFGLTAVFGFFAFFLFLIDKRPPWFSYLMSLIAGVSLALISEFIQLLVPDRSASFIDILIDSLGYIVFSSIVLGFGYLILKKRRKKKGSPAPEQAPSPPAGKEKG